MKKEGFLESSDRNSTNSTNTSHRSILPLYASFCLLTLNIWDRWIHTIERQWNTYDRKNRCQTMLMFKNCLVMHKTFSPPSSFILPPNELLLPIFQTLSIRQAYQQFNSFQSNTSTVGTYRHFSPTPPPPPSIFLKNEASSASIEICSKLPCTLSIFALLFSRIFRFFS